MPWGLFDEPPAWVSLNRAHRPRRSGSRPRPDGAVRRFRSPGTSRSGPAESKRTSHTSGRTDPCRPRTTPYPGSRCSWRRSPRAPSRQGPVLRDVEASVARPVGQYGYGQPVVNAPGVAVQLVLEAEPCSEHLRSRPLVGDETTVEGSARCNLAPARPPRHLSSGGCAERNGSLQVIGCEPLVADNRVEKLVRDEDAARERVTHAFLDLRGFPAIAGYLVDGIRDPRPGGRRPSPDPEMAHTPVDMTTQRFSHTDRRVRQDNQGRDVLLRTGQQHDAHARRSRHSQLHQRTLA